jgi:hypothetical protein
LSKKKYPQGNLGMYLFFIRHFNDIDHIVPVVWEMAMDKYPVAVYCLNPRYDINDDYRLNYLRRFGIEVDYVYNDVHHNLGMMHRILSFLVLLCFAIKRNLENNSGSDFTPLKKMMGKQAQIIGNRIYSFAKAKYYNIEWAFNFIKRKGAKALCFDWVKPKHSVVGVFVTAADRMSIPTLALPHGVFVYTNEHIAIESRPLATYDKLNRYDGVIVQNELFLEFMARSGLNREKIFVLGSARYCDKWMKQNKKILPRTLDSDTNDTHKLRIVFMTTKLRYRINVEKLLSTLSLLATFDTIEVKIKPHTRTTQESYIYENLPLHNAADISSVELCEWADVVLVIGSSIMLESLIQNKPVLYLKYLHENTTIYEGYGACWIIRSEDELKDALSALTENIKNVPYPVANVKRLISDIIYNNQMEREILKDYVDFIVSFKKG